MIRVLFAVLLLTGCATADKIYNQYGEEAGLIQCAGAGQAACFAKAEEFCSGPYTVNEKSNHPYTGEINTLIVSCGGADVQRESGGSF